MVCQEVLAIPTAIKGIGMRLPPRMVLVGLDVCG
jgi:hypothetical protein